MSSSALFFSSATPVSGLPVVVFAPATPQIDSDAPPELDSRVSRVLAEPIAAPARARTVEDEAPMDGRETAAPVFFVPFQVTRRRRGAVEPPYMHHHRSGRATAGARGKNSQLSLCQLATRPHANRKNMS